MQKVDFKKEYATLYKASSKKFEILTVPKLQYLMIDGAGDPNNSMQFQQAIECLFSLSYTLKFIIKNGKHQIDYGVMPLEGLWWSDNMREFSAADKSKWKWTLMIMQPTFISKELVEEAKGQLAKKKELPHLNEVRFEIMEEGLCAQILYIGPYSEETSTIQKLHEFIKESGNHLHGKHREIYLNDMRRTAPEKLKTIIRQPILQSGLVL